MIVALYARVSTVKQAEKELSIPDQLRQLREWCTRQGHGVAVEYVEPGASATDDRRPVFQQMIAEACGPGQPFEAVLVHSQSRFFRDLYGFLHYERQLTRAGVRLVSITQPTAEDAAGQMVRNMLSMFDQYSSAENSKHTLRAMQENARQGFFNGSRPPFGYRVEAVPLPGRKGCKKRLVVDAGEAELVRRVYALYLQGENGYALGLVGVARALNRQGCTCRGTRWTKGRVEAVLGNRNYVGEYTFNRKQGKTGQRKPEAEWVRGTVPPLLDRATFEAAARRRGARHPSQVPPRVVTAPSFLAGLLRCDCCGGGMTIATGKSGRYRYYRCQRAIGTGERCGSPILPAAILDQAVREALCTRVLVRDRLLGIMAGLRQRLQRGGDGTGAKLRQLRQELEANRRGTERLHQAVEAGLLPLGESLREEAHRLKARREALLLEIAALQRVELLPQRLLAPRHVEAFCQALRAKLMDETSGFGREYLRLLVQEIRVKGREVILRGGNAALAWALAGNGEGTPGAGVPSIGPTWLPGQDSNLQPSG